MFYGMNAWFLASLAMGAHWLVAGAAHPALSRLAPELGARAFLGVWSRGAPVLTLMVAGSAALGFVAAGDEPDPKWAVGAGFLAASLLVAALLSQPAAARLRESAAAEQAALLRRWGRLHLLRAVLLSVGVFFYIWAAH